MRTLPLADVHLRLGARMDEFGGWHMPIHYGSIVSEANAVRNRAGLFDISHMGRLDVSGPDAGQVLQYLTTNNIDALTDGMAQYTLFLNSSGGVLDDAVVYRVDPQRFFIVVNAANTEKDVRWISSHLQKGVSLTDRTNQTVLLALQGPYAASIIERSGASPAVGLGRFQFVKAEIGGTHCVISRTGYTGEDGFEIAAQAESGEILWQSLMKADGVDLQPCGLAARDVLRIEAGYPLHGHEIDEVTNPVEAGLMRFVKSESSDFVGRTAVLEALSRPQARLLMALEMGSRSVPRAGDLVFADGRQIGYVSSGTFSPTRQRGIALAFTEPEMAKWEQRVEVQIREARRPGVLRKPPLYSRRNMHAK